jgi:hypothetical protein
MCCVTVTKKAGGVKHQPATILNLATSSSKYFRAKKVCCGGGECSGTKGSSSDSVNVLRKMSPPIADLTAFAIVALSSQPRHLQDAV